MVTGLMVMTAYAVEVELYIFNLVGMGRISFVDFFW